MSTPSRVVCLDQGYNRMRMHSSRSENMRHMLHEALSPGCATAVLHTAVLSAVGRAMRHVVALPPPIRIKREAKKRQNKITPHKKTRMKLAQARSPGPSFLRFLVLVS